MQVHVDQYSILVCNIFEAFDLYVTCITLIILLQVSAYFNCRLTTAPAETGNVFYMYC